MFHCWCKGFWHEEAAWRSMEELALCDSRTLFAVVFARGGTPSRSARLPVDVGRLPTAAHDGIASRGHAGCLCLRCSDLPFAPCAARTIVERTPDNWSARVERR